AKQGLKSGRSRKKETLQLLFISRSEQHGYSPSVLREHDRPFCSTLVQIAGEIRCHIRNPDNFHRTPFLPTRAKETVAWNDGGMRPPFTEPLPAIGAKAQALGREYGSLPCAVRTRPLRSSGGKRVRRVKRMTSRAE